MFLTAKLDTPECRTRKYFFNLEMYPQLGGLVLLGIQLLSDVCKAVK